MSEKILVVDDEDPIRDLCGRVLSRQGYEVHFASDGKEALKKIEEHEFGLAVVDIKMPNMDGLSLLKAIKQRYNQPEVLMMTGYPSIETASEAIKSGIFSYIVKPFNLDEFNKEIKRCIDKQKRMLYNRVKLITGLNLTIKIVDSNIAFQKKMEDILRYIYDYLNLSGIVLIKVEKDQPYVEQWFGVDIEMVDEILLRIKHTEITSEKLIKVEIKGKTTYFIPVLVFYEQKYYLTLVVDKSNYNFNLEEIKFLEVAILCMGIAKKFEDSKVVIDKLNKEVNQLKNISIKNLDKLTFKSLQRRNRISQGLLKIGEVARISGLPISTLRYYTELGLIKVSRYSPGGYRLYDAKETIQRLSEIKYQIENNITLKEIIEKFSI